MLALAWWQTTLAGAAVAAVIWALFVVALYASGRGPAAHALARFIPDMVVLFKRLLGDARVPRRAKVVLWLCVGYLALPFDLVPDFIPVAGVIDDAVIVALVLRFSLRSSGPALITEHWPGPQQSLDTLLRLVGDPGVRRPISWLWAVVLGVLAPLALFALLAEDVSEHDVFGWDTSILHFMEHVQTPALTAVFKVFTYAGSGPGVTVLLLAVVALLLARHRTRDAVFMAVATGSCMALNVALKSTFDRPRPDLFPHLVSVSSSSFPSGHTMASMGFATAVVVVAWHTRYRRAAGLAAATFAVIVGLSRIYLGVHYPSDVVAGWAVAIAWVIGVKLVFDAFADSRSSRDESSDEEEDAGGIEAGAETDSDRSAEADADGSEDGSS